MEDDGRPGSGSPSPVAPWAAPGEAAPPTGAWSRPPGFPPPVPPAPPALPWGATPGGWAVPGPGPGAPAPAGGRWKVVVAFLGLVAVLVGAAVAAWPHLAHDAGVADGVATTLPPEAVERPIDVRMLTRAGGFRIRWAMPTVNLIDGPRPLKNIPAPAIGTFWASGGMGVLFRYDAGSFEHLEAIGADDSAIAHALVARLNGDPVEFGDERVLGGMVRLDYDEHFDDRLFVARAYSWRGTVFVLSVAVPEIRPDLVPRARAQLDALDATLVFDPA